MRVVCEDALRFARREARRGSEYEVILLDPPHYGRGPKGEVWRLEEHLTELIDVAGALAAEDALVVLSTYAVGYSPLAFVRMLEDLGGRPSQNSHRGRELAIPEGEATNASEPARFLPAGFCARWARGGGGGRTRVTKPMPLEVLHSCNHVLCVAKPAGTPTVPDDSRDESMLERAKAWVRTEFRKPGAVYLGVVHRLDRPVSGVLAFARTSKAAARLTAAFHDRVAQKSYIAITEAPPRAPEGTIEHWLLKKGSKNVVRIVAENTPGARLARTRFRTIASSDGLTLVDLRPETGRPHQLRVAMASLGAPLVGDLKYGASKPLPDKSVALHALRLAVPHPTRDESVRVWTPPSEDTALPWAPFRSVGIFELERPGPRS